MDKKLTKEEVVSQLSKAGNVTRREASTFLKALSETLLDGLNEDELVKVNGLGSFKITNVADRESVDVNTGERIVIPGYKKLSFTADKSLNAALNASEEERENMLANSAVEEPQHPVDEQPETVAEEPVVVAEQPQEPVAEQPETLAEEPVVEEEEPQEPVAEQPEAEAEEPVVVEDEPQEPVAEQPEAEAEEPVVVEDEPQEPVAEQPETVAEEPVVEEEAPQESVAEQPVVEEEEPKKEEVKPQTTETKPAEKKPINKWVWIGIAAAVVVVALIFLLTRSCQKADDGENAEAQQEEIVAPKVITNRQSGATVASDKVKEVTPQHKVHILQKGESLTTISVMYYQTKDSMGAIWRLNGFEDPNNIPLGTEILLP